MTCYQADPKTIREIFARFQAQDRDNRKTFLELWARAMMPEAAVYGWRRLVFRAVQFGATEREAVEKAAIPLNLHLERLNRATAHKYRLSRSDAIDMLTHAARHALIIREGGGVR